MTRIQLETNVASLPTIRALIKQYGLKTTGTGDQILCQCPLSRHSQHGEDGVDENPSCSVNLKKNCWNCFVCHESGGVLAFKRALEGGRDALGRIKRAGGGRRRRAGGQPRAVSLPTSTVAPQPAHATAHPPGGGEGVAAAAGEPEEPDDGHTPLDSLPPPPHTEDVLKDTNQWRAGVIDAIANSVDPQPPTITLGSHVELATELHKRFPDLMYTQEAFWDYDIFRGVWKKLEESALARVLHGWDGQTYQRGNHICVLKLTDGTIRGVIRTLADIVAKPNIFDIAQPLVLCKNGVVEVTREGITVREPRREDYQTFCLDFEWNPVERPAADRFCRALLQWFLGDPDGRAKLAVLQEFIGAAVMGLAPTFQKTLLLTGRGTNGKSTFLTVIEALFPDEAKTSVNFSNFNQPYYVATLAGKRLNVCSEMPTPEMTGTDLFKDAVTGGMLTGRNPTERPHRFKCRAAHIFAGNTLPRVTDNSDGFWRRLLLVTFDRQLPETAITLDLDKEIIATELPGVLTWALEGAQRLMQNGKYTVPESSKMEVRELAKDSNPVYRWLDDECVVIDAPGATTKRLYDHFVMWCESMGHKPIPCVWFARRLAALNVPRYEGPAGRGFHLALKRPSSIPL